MMSQFWLNIVLYKVVMPYNLSEKDVCVWERERKKHTHTQNERDRIWIWEYLGEMCPLEFYNKPHWKHQRCLSKPA